MANPGEPTGLKEVDRSVVEQVARIVGRHSAAQQALDDADRREAEGERVRFCQGRGTWFVFGTKNAEIED